MASTCSSALTSSCNILRVATKLMDILADPQECNALITEPIVRLKASVAQLFRS